MLRERTDRTRICIRKVMGAICVGSGIVMMFIKLFYTMVTQLPVLYEGRAQALLYVGGALLGSTGLDSLLNRRSGT